jgi:hypothetical protein
MWFLTLFQGNIDIKAFSSRHGYPVVFGQGFGTWFMFVPFSLALK